MQHIILLDDYVLLDYFEIKLIKKHVKYVKGFENDKNKNVLPSYLEYNIDSILRRCEADERIIKREIEKRRESFDQ